VTGEDGLAAFLLAQACALSLRERRTVSLRRRQTPEGIAYDPTARASMSV